MVELVSNRHQQHDSTNVVLPSPDQGQDGNISFPSASTYRLETSPWDDEDNSLPDGLGWDDDGEIIVVDEKVVLEETEGEDQMSDAEYLDWLIATYRSEQEDGE